MESLAVLVAIIFIGLIAVSVASVVMAMLYRKGKVRLWVAATLNAVVGFLAMWGIGTVWTLAVAPLASMIISSILITLPKKDRAE